MTHAGRHIGFRSLTRTGFRPATTDTRCSRLRVVKTPVLGRFHHEYRLVGRCLTTISLRTTTAGGKDGAPSLSISSTKEWRSSTLSGRTFAFLYSAIRV